MQASELHGLSCWIIDFSRTVSAAMLLICLESNSQCFLGFDAYQLSQGLGVYNQQPV